MKRKAFTLFGVALALALSADVAFGHGGSYQGPQGGGTPGYSGPAGGATPSPNPGPGPTPGGGGTTPGTSGGTTGPETGGGTGPTRPGARPTSAGPAGGRGGRGGTTGRGKAKNSGPRFNDWDWWWDLNEERFLNLKNKVRSAAKASDNADVFLGEEPTDDVAEVTTRMIRNRILPVLKQAVKDDYFDARSGALIALGKVADAKDTNIIDTIKSYLGDENKQVRETACLALGILGSKDTVPLLMDIVNNTRKAKEMLNRGTSDVLNRTRAFAAVAVGLIGNRGGFDDDNGTQVIEELLRLTRTPVQGDRDIAVGPALALGLVKSEKAIPGMIEIFSNPRIDDYVRAHVGTSLGKVGARSATKVLLKALKDKKVHVQRSAAIALGLITPPDDRRTVKQIRQYAKGASDRGTRNFCIMALGEIASPEARSTLTDLLRKGKNQHDRTFAALALGVAGFNRDDESRDEVGKLLLKSFTSAKSSSERGAYAVALGLLEYTQAAPELMKVLDLAGQQVLKGFCCTALGLMNERNAIPIIQSLVKQRADVDLRKNAAIALGLLKDPEAVDTLKEVIESNAKSKAILGAATVALGYIGDSRAIPILQVMLEKNDAGVYNAKDVTRAFATVGMGFLGDKDPIPMLSKVQENSNYLAQTSALAELLSIL